MSADIRAPELVVGALYVISFVLILSDQYLPHLVLEPYLLSAFLGTIFIGVGYTTVAYISARSYLKTHAPVFVLIGAALLSSAAGALSFWVSAVSNFRTTVESMAAFESALFMLSSAVVAYRGGEPSASSGSFSKVATAYAAVLLVIILVGEATYTGNFPVFFVPGVGGTPLRQGIVASAVSLEAFSVLIFFLVYRRSHVEILYWYPLAISLLALGTLDGFFAVYLGGFLSWTGRISVYLSGIYFLLAALRRPRTKPSART